MSARLTVKCALCDRTRPIQPFEYKSAFEGRPDPVLPRGEEWLAFQVDGGPTRVFCPDHKEEGRRRMLAEGGEGVKGVRATKDSDIPDTARVWGEVWLGEDFSVNFKSHTTLDFTRSKYAMGRFARLIQERIANAEMCPFHEEDPGAALQVLEAPMAQTELRDFERGGEVVFSVTYKSEMFDIVVVNRIGEPVELRLTEKKKEGGE